MAARSDKKHTEEFKAEAIKMVRESGRTIKSVAQEIGVGESTLHSWLNKKSRGRANLPGIENSDEWSARKQLRKENRRLRMEAEFLKKAAAFFAKESK